MVRALFLGASVLVFGCASTEHQPRAFDPHFPSRPEWGALPKVLTEIRTLETKKDRRVWETRRLVRLYQYELRDLDPRSDRYETVRLKIEELKPLVQDLHQEIVAVQLSRMKGRRSRVSGHSSPQEWVKDFDEVKELWNRDENKRALRLLENILIHKKKMRRVGKRDRIKMQYVRFRLAMDLLDRPRQLGALRKLEDLDRCSTYTTEAAFRLTIMEWVDQVPGPSRWHSLCHKKLTDSQRLYWEARILGGEKALENYEELTKKRLPHYYAYQAAFRLGRKIEPFPKASRIYLEGPWEISEENHKRLLRAEEALSSGARKDALIFLRKVAENLDVNEDRLMAALYTASLFRASGAFLESFRLNYKVDNLFEKEDIERERWPQIQFARDLFPTPFVDRVRWLCRLWNVDPDFVYAIMRQESSFHPQAISVAKAKGLMQLMPFMGKAISGQLSYGPYYDEDHLLHAEENLKLSIFHIRQLRAKADHPILMAAAYNAGILRVYRWWRRWGHLPLDAFIELIPNRQTRNYAKYAFRNQIAYRVLRTGEPVGIEVISQNLPVPPEKKASL